MKSQDEFQPHFLQIIFDPISSESPLDAKAIDEISCVNASDRVLIKETLGKYVRPYFLELDQSLKEEILKALDAAIHKKFDVTEEFDIEELLVDVSDIPSFLEDLRQSLLD